jgi:hypothetical protein
MERGGLFIARVDRFQLGLRQIGDDVLGWA